MLMNAKAFFTFLKSSIISLIILVLIGFILPITTQVNSIVVDFYYSPINFFFLLGFSFTYAVMLSHYPNYLFLGNSKKDREWHIAKHKLFFFGIVWYTKKNKSSTGKEIEERINFLRRTLGVFFYGALFFMIFYTYQVNYELSSYSSYVWSILFVVFMIIWLWFLNNSKNEWKRINYVFIKNSIKNANYNITPPSSFTRIKIPIIIYLVSLLVAVFIHLVFFYLLLSYKDAPYRRITIVFSLLCVISQTIPYLYYRTYRSIFKYVFFNNSYNAILNSFSFSAKKNVETFFNKDNAGDKIRFSKVSFIPFGVLSNNITFLQITSIAGFINFVFLIYLNIYPLKSVAINSIVVVLSYFFLFYGVVVVLIKHIIFYRFSYSAYAKRNQGKFLGLITASLLVLIILNFFAKKSNNLHVLTELDKEEEVPIEEVLSKNDSVNYYIGSYGGGMKSNAWTLLVLNRLKEEIGEGFFDKTLVMSGASGGTMGIINMTSLQYNYPKDSLASKIEQISTSNILSIDFTHAFGRDLLISYFSPFKTDIYDRSKSAMLKYAQLTGYKDEFDKVPYRTYYKKVFDSRNSYPILIANTTNIKGKHGMAISASTDNSLMRSIIYKGADSILDLPNRKTLGYYAAASTSNRFPVLSPSARIEKLGHYNDGGIFENSGLLGAYNTYLVKKHITPDSIKTKSIFINIVNDKNLYIKSFLEPKLKDLVYGSKPKVNEALVIIQSIASTEMFPNYIKSELKLLEQLDSTVVFKSIYLPHTFNLGDVEKIYGNFPYELKKEIDSLIKNHDESIKKSLAIYSESYRKTNAIVEPPMSRFMAKPAFEFMNAMLHHKSVKQEVESVREE